MLLLGHKRSALWDRLVKIYIFPEGLHVLKTGGKDELSSSKLFFFVYMNFISEFLKEFSANNITFVDLLYCLNLLPVLGGGS